MTIPAVHGGSDIGTTLRTYVRQEQDSCPPSSLYKSLSARSLQPHANDIAGQQSKKKKKHRPLNDTTHGRHAPSSSITKGKHKRCLLKCALVVSQRDT